MKYGRQVGLWLKCADMWKVWMFVFKRRSSLIFMPFFVRSNVLIQIASLIFRSVVDCAVSMIAISIFSDEWFGWLKCCAMPVLFLSLMELLCPVNRTFSLPCVSPMYICLHMLHLIIYIRFIWLHSGGRRWYSLLLILIGESTILCLQVSHLMFLHCGTEYLILRCVARCNVSTACLISVSIGLIGF